MRSNAKRVLIVSMLFPSSSEQAKAPFVLRVAKRLAEQCQVKVIAPVRILPGYGLFRKLFPRSPDIPVAPLFEKIDGIDVYHPRIFFPPRVMRFFHGFIYFFAILPLVKRIRKRFDFDVINAPYLYPDGLAGALVGRYMKKPVIIEARGCDVNLLLQYRTRRWLIAYACRLADKVITVNNELKQKLKDIGVSECRLTVIPNGVDREEFMPLDRDACRKELGLPGDKTIVLFAGSLEKVKGVTYLVEAWKRISGESEKYFLALVGDGREKTAVLALIKRYGLGETVLVAGAKPYPDIPLWMNAADIVCLPSIREGCPNVLLEAIACGKYVVATAVGGIPEIVTPASGILVPPKNMDALAAALRHAMARKSGVAVDSGGIRSWRTAADERLDVFGSVLRPQDVAGRREEVLQ